MKPAIILHPADLENYANMKHLADKCHQIRENLKPICEYRFDNQYFYLTDGVRDIAVSFKFNDTNDNMIVSEAASGYYITSFTHLQDLKDSIHIIFRRLRRGYHVCNCCGKWKKLIKMIRYGDLMYVCHTCYDPKIHTQINTVGD